MMLRVVRRSFCFSRILVSSPIIIILRAEVGLPNRKKAWQRAAIVLQKSDYDLRWKPFPEEMSMGDC